MIKNYIFDLDGLKRGKLQKIIDFISKYLESDEYININLIEIQYNYILDCVIGELDNGTSVLIDDL